jgi:hypothetical protein
VSSPPPTPDRQPALLRGAAFVVGSVLWLGLIGRLPDSWLDYLDRKTLTTHLLVAALCLPGLAAVAMAVARFHRARRGQWDLIGLASLTGLLASLLILLLYVFLIVARFFASGGPILGG